MNFQERLIELRKMHNITQRNVSDAIEMSPLGYQRYEYGAREPAFRKLIALADFYHVSIDYLVGRTDNPEINR